MDAIRTTIRNKHALEHGTRRAFTLRFPFFLPVVLFAKRLIRNLHVLATGPFSKKIYSDFFPNVVTRHSSPLFRKLGDSDPHLHEGKIQNLTIALKKLDGLIIPPGCKFSFWHALGNPTKKKGYTTGMLLSDGKVVEGIGGGLCQLSNLLYWMFLHTPVRTIERKHHSRDAFPDNRRTIPFGSGATVFYNLIDLKIHNTTPYPLQLHLWLTENQLKGQTLSTHQFKEKYHLYEKNSLFAEIKNTVYRYNELWRDTLVHGEKIKEEKITTNCAKVLYTPNNVDIAL